LGEGDEDAAEQPARAAVITRPTIIRQKPRQCIGQA
jgi:hypothetical protein